MCRSRVYQEIRANSKVVDPDDEKRLEVKRKPIDEPKLDEPTPQTPQDLGNDADAAMDEEIHGNHGDLGDNVDDTGMDNDNDHDTTEFYREVDDAMAEESDDIEMVAFMDVLQTLGVDV